VALRYVILLNAVLVLLAVLALWKDPHFFFRDDGQSHSLAGFCEVARLCRSGTFPLLTDRSWQSGALAAEYQFGVFSPVQTALVLALFSCDLPLHYSAAVFFSVFAAILATGTYVLARSYRVSPPLAVMAALVATLNGWIVIWGVNWLPAVGGFAWMPWVWWAVRRLLQSTRRRLPWTVLVAVFVALVILAGYPFAVLMVLVLAGWLSVDAVARRRRLRACWPVLLGVGLGVALSAPAWMMLIEYTPATARDTLDRGSMLGFFLSVPPQAYLGMILPSISIEWQRFTLSNLPPAEMNVGIAPIVLLLAALMQAPRRLLATVKSEGIFLALVMVLAMLPSLGSFRWMFRWLPLCFLTLAVVAARAAELLRREAALPAAERSGNGRASTIARAVLMILAVQVILLARDATTWYAAARLPLLLVGIGWYFVERFRRFLPAAAADAMPAAVVVASSLALYWVLPIQSYAGQTWRLPAEVTQTGPFDPSITYLSLYSPADQRRGPMPRRASHLRPGNVHFYSGLKAINGYSPLRPRGLCEKFTFDEWSAVGSRRHTLLASGAAPGPLLRRMGVDGLAVSRSMRSQMGDLPLDEFVEVAELEDSVVYHRRTGRSPAVHCVERALIRRPADTAATTPGVLPLLEPAGDVSLPDGPAVFDTAVTRVIDQRPDRVLLAVDAAAASRPVLLSFARAWYPGYQAFLNDSPLPCHRLDGILPAVILPPGSRGRLLLVYRPLSLRIGLTLAALTAAGLALAAAWAGRVKWHWRLASVIHSPFSPGKPPQRT
jgi:hypothetical protein